jgi:hypothetical protein
MDENRTQKSKKKEKMSSFVDLDTGKIIGCRKNSPVWWHEKGHIKFSKTDKAIKYDYMSGYFFKAAVLFMVFALFLDSIYLKVIIAIFIFRSISYEIYEELWAWHYAYKNKNKWYHYKKV